MMTWDDLKARARDVPTAWADERGTLYCAVIEGDRAILYSRGRDERGWRREGEVTPLAVVRLLFETGRVGKFLPSPVTIDITTLGGLEL